MKEAFIKLHISIIIAGATGVFGKLITLNEGLLVWWRMMFATLILAGEKVTKTSFERNTKD